MEVASVDLWHLNDGVTTKTTGSHTSIESRPNMRASRCLRFVKIRSGKVTTSYPAPSTRHRRSSDLGAGTGTNSLDPMSPSLLLDLYDARTTVRLPERISEWSAT